MPCLPPVNIDTSYPKRVRNTITILYLTVSEPEFTIAAVVKIINGDTAAGSFDETVPEQCGWFVLIKDHEVEVLPCERDANRNHVNESEKIG